MTPLPTPCTAGTRLRRTCAPPKRPVPPGVRWHGRAPSLACPPSGRRHRRSCVDGIGGIGKRVAGLVRVDDDADIALCIELDRAGCDDGRTSRSPAWKAKRPDCPSRPRMSRNSTNSTPRACTRSGMTGTSMAMSGSSRRTTIHGVDERAMPSSASAWPSRRGTGR